MATEGLRAPQITDLELDALAEWGGRASWAGASAPMPALRMSGNADEDQRAMEERERRIEEDRRKELEELAKAREAFRGALDNRLAEVFQQGADAAVAKSERTAWNARSVALYLVLLSIVSMPVFAILSNVNAETFGTYIAPVTGIAGTVVGYWFGSVERQSSSGK